MAFKVEKKLLKAVSSGVNYSCRNRRLNLQIRIVFTQVPVLLN